MVGTLREAFRGLKPTMTQAGVYSSVLHYLRAVAASGSTDGKVVADKMRDLPIRIRSCVTPRSVRMAA